MVQIPTILPQTEEISNDKDVLRDKQKVMNKQYWNSMFYSATQIFTFMAGVMTAAGMGIVGAALKEGATTLAAIPQLGLVFLGIAAAATVLAVGANMVGARYFHSANFDQLELNAQHTAKYLVKEIKRENACIQTQEHPQNQRCDGKAWAEVVKASQTIEPGRTVV